MRIKITFYGLRLMAMLLLWCGAVTMQAQNNYFSIAGGLPHLPVFANTAAVPAASLKPGAMVYSTADGTVMIYSGDTWDTFCTQLQSLTTGAYPQFSVVGGIPYLPVFATTAVTSTTGQAGTLYYPSDQAGLRVNNSVNWFTLGTLAAAPVTNAYVMAGKLSGLTGGVAIPVKAADPTFAATDQGALYLNSTDFKLHVNNGTAWVAVDCNACPPYASGVTVNLDDPANMTNIVGGYAYFQKTDVHEVTNGSLFRWRIATDALGTGATLDPTTTLAYTPGYSDALDSKYLQFEVRPKGLGLALGAAVTSPWTQIKNCPPQVSGALLALSDTTFSTTSQVQVSYAYFDSEGNSEGSSIVKWYKSDDAAGTQNLTTLNTGANSDTYTYTYSDADQSKYLLGSVIAKALKGYSTGTITYSPTVKIWNCPPQASGALLALSDTTFSTTSQVQVSYSYFDREGDSEGSSIVTWYKADDAAGTQNLTTLNTGTNASTYTYTYAEADQGKYLLGGVVAKALKGYSTGVITYSPSVKIQNCPPQAWGTIYGDFVAMTSNTFSDGGYSYFDREGDPENTGGLGYRWFLSTGAGGTGTTTALGTGTGYTYTYTDGDDGKYLNLGVTVKASKGFSTSNEAVVSQLLKNCPPQASGVTINGTLTVGQTLTAGYAYYDSEGNAEGTSTYQWYRDNVSTPISGATSANYTLTSSDTGHTIGVGVTPKAATGYSTGAQSTMFTSTTI